MVTEDQHEKIIEQLVLLNRQVAKTNSFSRMLVIGIMYGIGFVIGSAIIATLALGFFAPWFAEIPWVRSSFETGNSIVQ
ncbi:hypothetical protein COU18_00755 [Candidatus Kaiserbacteria bacterium CG10_big_fil_rev_8_21_14_0_10_51_14]|uniref:Uncharacterized protein n=1 Tax=Candidatus Kaiserbacteria bacterium CG10_big_fil_rev_8_21_14_0_10_51_14 TaxID=1974610 RepID=A0A2H0UBX9_9BACT|nr:MAG: hypothetical protein COU18_00755 [Candidatus Kaiserbacteria bacterium CG10_big_fil_rev_8_21_14_0_10_51_14]